MRRAITDAQMRARAEEAQKQLAEFRQAHAAWLKAVDRLEEKGSPLAQAELEWNRQRVVSSHLWGSDQDPKMYWDRIPTLLKALGEDHQ